MEGALGIFKDWCASRVKKTKENHETCKEALEKLEAQFEEDKKKLERFKQRQEEYYQTLFTSAYNI